MPSTIGTPVSSTILALFIGEMNADSRCWIDLFFGPKLGPRK